jgi:RNA polymerase sigma factor (sigma-70 family)
LTPTSALGSHSEDLAGEASLEHFYREHSLAVYRYLLGQCREPQMAEDLMQDTFIKATRSLAGYRGGSPRAWLLTIARTTFLDAVRRRRDMPVAEAPDTAITDPDVVAVETVRTVLATLPEAQRSALILRDELDLTYEEVAATLGKSLGATKVLIHRARAAFRVAYGAQG